MSSSVSGSAGVPSPVSSSYQSIRIPIDSYSAFISVDTWRSQWAGQILQLGKDASKYVLITDENIDRLYGHTLRDLLKQAGLDVLYLVLPPGEQTKCRETKAMIEDWMFSHNCGRDTVILAFGGGVIGDLCGYVASGYMRGIPFIQLPTSFLAMVDSSIGGKTGIDTPAGKNLLGAFHRPLAVLIDLSLLLTLPQRELCNGMAESIKAGIIASVELFELMESNVEGLLKQKDLTLLAQVVEKSVAIKAHVVLNDEKEAGLRSILNFGHSIGHAIEALMQPELLHGECVAVGMIEEIILARSYGLVGSGELRRVDNILKSFSLPTKVPAHLSPSGLLQKMSIDKKNKNGKKELVLVTSIGSVKSQPKYTTMIPDSELELLLNQSIGIIPVSVPVSGSVSVPGSKSLSNRILLLAALGEGDCIVEGLLHSQDTQVMLDSLRALGIEFEWRNNLKELLLHGCSGRLATPKKDLFLNNAGTASRFLTSVACLIQQGEIILKGNARMHERPIGDLVDSLRRCGQEISYLGKEGCLPLKIKANGSGLSGGAVKLNANISSQYVSSILLAAPYASGENLTLSLETSAGKKVVSKPFIDMTVQLMRRFGIQIIEPGQFQYTVSRGSWKNPSKFLVEGDASSATYPLALAAITGGTITVENVGSESLQGDAKFCEVLQSMGCKVTQTATTTTVTGPDFSKGEILKAVEKDMDTLTDTFMTLAAVAVFAVGTTKITNIANQRVKECNRLAVMCEELTKIGVQAQESETGIDIVGVGMDPKAIQRLSDHIANRAHQSAVIACHDDHRIAMSFALIGSRVQGIILDEKRCVDKTYPEFWEHLAQKFKVGVFPPKEGVVTLHSVAAPPVTTNTSCSSSSSSASASSSSRCTSSVILIGMRGSGKTHLGRALAKELNRTFLDLDEVLETKEGLTCKQIVERDGWPTFRMKELEVLKSTLSSHAPGSVISCGGGIVETPEALSLLSKQPLVIQLRRHIEDVVSYLASDATRPGFDARTVWESRQPLYVQASRFEFPIVQADLDWPAVEKDFIRFVRGIVYPKKMPQERNTFFLSLTLADLSAYSTEALRDHVALLSRGVDAIEVRVDLITPTFNEEKARTYIALLRRVTDMPFIYTVRSKKQGGAFGDYESLPEGEEQIAKQIAFGFRLACDAVDLEVAIPAATREKLYALRSVHPSTLIISSHHEPRSNGGTLDDLKRLFERCARGGAEGTGGKPDIVKVVVAAANESDALRLIQASQEIDATFRASHGPKIIALAMGSAGRLSRVANQVLTPVTHPALPTAAAPGQMSVQEIMRVREGLGWYPFNGQGKRQWLLFGSPITHSPSPVLHNAAFQYLHLDGAFSYGKFDTTSVSVVELELKKPEFQGGNVTIPLKEACMSLVQSRSEAVRAIGALNTIVRQSDGSLRGENTDWQGIRLLIESRIGSSPRPIDVAIVIGAGGTARAAIYALQQTGFSNSNILVFNPRTKEKAVTLAQHFHVEPIHALDRPTIAEATILQEFTIRVLVSTIPGSVGMRIEDSHLFDQQTEKPLAMDASYIPADTPFLLQCMHEFGVPESRIIRGLDLLIAQGWFGMEAWIGKPLPTNAKQAMERAVREAYSHQQQGIASATTSNK